MAYRNRNKTKAAALLVLIISALFYWFTVKGTGAPVPTGRASANDEMSFSETGVKLTYNYDSAASFYSYNSENFYFCTKDGIKYMNSKGEKLWEDVFTMTSPVMVGECENVIVGEPNGNVIYVYSPAGRMYTSQFSGNIMHFAMNPAGYAAVIVKREADYETQALDNKTGERLWGFLHKDENVYPICADISNDGRMLAISMLDTNVYMTTYMIFAYTDSKEAKPYADSIFGSVSKEDQIVGSLNFLENNNLISFSDMEISRVSLEDENGLESGETIEMNNKIDFIGFLGDKGFVLALGDRLVNKEGENPGVVAFYDALGKLAGSYELGRKASYLSCGNGYVIVGANRSYYAFNSKGKLLWRYHATKDYKQLVFLENSDVVLFATNTEATIMKRGKAR